MKLTIDEMDVYTLQAFAENLCLLSEAVDAVEVTPAKTLAYMARTIAGIADRCVEAEAVALGED